MNYVMHGSGDLDSQEKIQRLVADLRKDDGLVRQRARQTLVEMGHRVVPILIDELRDPHDHARWEAAKALCELTAPEAAPALIERLEDEDFSVRWLAAEALIGLGDNAIAPLLQALMRRPDSAWLRQGAHHVFRDLTRKGERTFLQPVLAALDDVQPILIVPVAAEEALRQFETTH